MNESLTLQIGQCGNQIGNEFWDILFKEHENNEGRVEKYFYTKNSMKVPRTLLIDLEPRAISPRLKTNNNTFLFNEGTGAGNNWAHGYFIGQKSKEELLELINKHLESCDLFENFNFIHSTAGGTGSGLGSFLSDLVKENFNEKMLINYSILPNNNETSEVVVQPYNTVLTLERLQKNSDNIIIMDNYGLNRQINIKEDFIDFNSINGIASEVMSSYSSLVRFPCFMYCNLRSFLNVVVPYNDFKFVIPSYFNSSLDSNLYFNDSNDIVNALNKHKNFLADFDFSNVCTYFSKFNLLQSNVNLKSLHRTQSLIQSKINFMDLPFYLSSPTQKKNINVSLNNSTSAKNVFRKICIQFDKLRKRNAFLELYKNFNFEIESMDEARENIEKLINKYENI